MDILFCIHELVLERLDDRKIPNFNRNHIYAVFDFDKEWKDLEKYALFVAPNDEKYVVYLGYGKEKRCLIPNEILKNAFFGVSVFADDLLVSTQERVLLSPSGYSADIDDLDLEDSQNVIINNIDEDYDLHRNDEEFFYFRQNKHLHKEEHLYE